MLRVFTSTMALLAAALLAAAPASACGGFFCSSVPIDQSGERVLFGVHDGKVTAHIQIMYQGAAERFAWVVPVPSQPTRIDVGTDQLFTAITSRTQPRFNLNWVNQNGCWYSGGFFGMEADGGEPMPTAGGRDANAGVQVLEESQAGPYDYAVIKGTNQNSGEAVFQWLKDNDYDQPEMSKDLIVTYVAEQHVFVALKLQSSQDVGDIQPLVMDFPFPASCVPLRLTSIAATDDMDVWVYMLGMHRSVPVNYFNVEINERQINWLRNGNNYADVAREAIDTAAGRGFLTEYAGDTNDMKGVLYKPGQYDTDALLEIETPWDFIDALLSQNFPRTPQMQNILRNHIPMPDAVKEMGVPEQQFYNNLENYQEYLKDLDFDTAVLVAEIEEKLLAPLMEANELFNQFRYMTRMYTIISPDEMTRDPIFLFNPDLPNVNNWHRATAKAICKDGDNQADKVLVTLEDGTEMMYDVPKENWDDPILENADMVGGAAQAVQRMYTSGAPEDISLARIAEVDNEFDTITVGLVTDNRPGGTDSTDRPRVETAPATSSGGCTVGQSGSPLGFALAGLLVLVGMLSLRRVRQ